MGASGPPRGGAKEQRGASLYFAYGSNLDLDQMAQRCPGARLVGTARLDAHRLAFAGTSRLWGGGVATVVWAPDWSVPGALFAIGPAELAVLDAFEGHPWFYRRRVHDVLSGDGARRRAVLYALDEEVHDLAPPADRYVGAIRRGYVHHGFDADTLAEAIVLATAGRGEA